MARLLVATQPGQSVQDWPGYPVELCRGESKAFGRASGGLPAHPALFGRQGQLAKVHDCRAGLAEGFHC